MTPQAHAESRIMQHRRELLKQTFSDWKLDFEPLTSGQIATAVVGATLLFGCEVRGFSGTTEERRI